MDGLFDKLYGTSLHGIYGSRHVTVFGHDDEGCLLPVLVYPVENLDAASIWQTKVTKNQVIV